MKYKQNQSLLDYLQNIIPNLQNQVNILNKNAEILYSLWRQSNDIGKNNKIEKPVDFDSKDILNLEKSGYVQVQGKLIKLTEKGIKTIREMILNDDYHAFESKYKQSSIKLASINDKNKNWYKKLL